MAQDGRRRRMRQPEIGGWPVNESRLARQRAVVLGGGMRRSEAERHAAKAWERCRFGACARVGGNPLAKRTVDLTFVSMLADHLVRCPECWRRGRDGDRAADWIEWAVRRRAYGDVLEVVQAELRRGRGAA